MKKLAKIFSMPKKDYREKDQRIVSRWLKELGDEDMNEDEVMDLCLRFVVSATTSIYGPTSHNRKMIVKRFDDLMKETFTVVAKEIKKGKF